MSMSWIVQSTLKTCAKFERVVDNSVQSNMNIQLNVQVVIIHLKVTEDQHVATTIPGQLQFQITDTNPKCIN